MRLLKTLLLILIFLVCINYSFSSIHLQVNDEKGKVISYYDEYYVVQVNGSVTVTNAYNNTLYNVFIPFNLDTLLIFEMTNTEYIETGQLKFDEFEALETKTFEYEIRGVVANNPRDGNKSVFLSAIENDKANMQPLFVSKLEKAEIEMSNIDSGDIVSVAGRRLVSIDIDNPTDITYNISAVHVIKTPSLDVNEEMIRWSFPQNSSYMILEPNTHWIEDITDMNSSDGEVYWLKVDVDTDFELFLNDTHKLNEFNQDDLLNPENLSVEEQEVLGDVEDYLEHMMYVKKSISSTQVFPGDIIDVDIRINNFAPISRNLTVIDTIPLGFNLMNGSGASIGEDGKLTWKVNVNPDSSARVFYKLKYTNEELLGVDYFDAATIFYTNNSLYTKRIPFVRKYVPEKKIFVQKKIRSSVNDEFVVDLSVHNLGESSLNDLTVKEFLSAKDVFREITQLPEDKGIWKLAELKSGEVWEVSYVTNENTALTALPQVFGIEKSTMLSTLVFENVVKNEWYAGTSQFLDRYGWLFVIFIPLTGVFINRWRRTWKERTFRSMGKKIHKMKEDSVPNLQDSIDFLKKDSEKKSNLPDVQKLNLLNIDNQQVKGFDDVQSKEFSKTENQEEAHENLDNLKKLHNETNVKKE